MANNYVILFSVWSEVGECLLKKDKCDFFTGFYLAIGNYLCPSPTCSVKSNLHCQAGLYELQIKHPSGVPNCECSEKENFCRLAMHCHC